MPLYRITIYTADNEKDVFEMDDEDEFYDLVQDCLRDLEKGEITSFVISKRKRKGT